jgi:hypothetical protein
MKRVALFSAWLAVGSGLVVSRPALAKEPAPPARPTVQIAILLDTSNSMDGLIGQAKTQLWNVVNEFVRPGRTAGPRPSRSPCSSTARVHSRPTRASCA